MKESGVIVGLSLILCLVGFLTRDFFLSFSMTTIMGEDISFNESWKLPYQTFPFLLFLFSLGSIPFLYLIVKKICKLSTARSKYLSIILITTSALIFWMIRVIYLKLKAASIRDLLQRAEFAENADIPSIRFEEVNLEIFIMVGLIVGMLLSLMIFRQNKRKTLVIN